MTTRAWVKPKASIEPSCGASIFSILDRSGAHPSAFLVQSGDEAGLSAEILGESRLHGGYFDIVTENRSVGGSIPPLGTTSCSCLFADVH
jgi:hypothetical protein